MLRPGDRQRNATECWQAIELLELLIAHEGPGTKRIVGSFVEPLKEMPLKRLLGGCDWCPILALSRCINEPALYLSAHLHMERLALSLPVNPAQAKPRLPATVFPLCDVPSPCPRRPAITPPPLVAAPALAWYTRPHGSGWSNTATWSCRSSPDHTPLSRARQCVGRRQARGTDRSRWNRSFHAHSTP